MRPLQNPLCVTGARTNVDVCAGVRVAKALICGGCAILRFLADGAGDMSPARAEKWMCAILSSDDGAAPQSAQSGCLRWHRAVASIATGAPFCRYTSRIPHTSLAEISRSSTVRHRRRSGSYSHEQFALIACAALVLCACEQAENLNTAEHAQRSTAVKHESGTERMPAESETPIVLSGMVEKMPWTKSGESWNAGGSEYFVLVTDEPGGGRPAGSRWIMRPTDAHPFDTFSQYESRRVEITGRRAGSIVFDPAAGMPYPVEPNKPGKAVRGGGIIVDSIIVLTDR